ncbi:MAG: YqeG family HAD IIIA-type phosphatase [Slackia sp.]|nr:YqeG family HAD IIIA-type phosphatase [Slackia sp.]
MPFFKPDRFLSRVTALDPVADIVQAGFTHVFLDLDNTLLTRDTHEVPSDIKEWLDRLREAGVSPCILTNNWHHGAHEWAQRLDLPIVSHAVKPLPFAYCAAMKKVGARRKSTLCIGDQLITDVWGGHVLGMSVVMVKPLVEADLKHTLMLRHVEKLFMRDVYLER